MSRIVFLNRFFYPDLSATSQLLSDLAFHLAATGREVHVVTGQLTYSDHPSRLSSEETIRGVAVHRLRSGTKNRTTLLGKALNYASFYASAASRLTRTLGPKDVLVAKTDPPLLSVLAASMGGLRRSPIVNWLQDLYPEIGAELGVPLLGGPLGNSLLKLRNRSLQRAACNVAIGSRMAERLFALGISPESVAVIPNWTDDENITPIPAERNPLRREWQLEGSFVIGYSGNLGRAHELDTLIGAAEILRDCPTLKFLFVGGGHLWAALRSAVESKGLRNFAFRPYQPRDRLALTLSVPDLHWISLRPELEGLIMPSKLYGIAAAGRPILVVSSCDGELAELVSRNQAGVSVAVGDSATLANHIVRFAEDKEMRELVGQNARQMLEQSYSRKVALRRWADLIEELMARG
jgi:colanic acid biosynthesis glycosyl transferase WcaI